VPRLPRGFRSFLRRRRIDIRIVRFWRSTYDVECVSDRAGLWMFAVLSFPVLIVFERLSAVRFPGLWGYISFAVNASVWGLAAVVACRRLRARASRPR
jgi:hypothetical protein